MEKIVNYRIIASSGTEDLVRQVNQFIDEGYQPFGAPFVNRELFCQAMTLTEKEAANRAVKRNSNTFTPRAISG